MYKIDANKICEELGIPEFDEPMVGSEQYDVAVFMQAGDQPFGSDVTMFQYQEICTSEDREFQDALDDFNNADESGEYEDACTDIIDACFDSIWTKIAMLNALGLNFQEIWEEGCKSNFSKISPNGKFIKNAAGKIQKPEGWIPPDFRQFAQKIKFLKEG